MTQHARMFTVSLSLLLAVAAPDAPPADGAPGSRVVALPLVDDGAGPELTNTATSLTAVSLSRVPGLNVLSGDDVSAAADVEAQRQMLGCSEASCLAEIAAALGADRMVHGRVGRLGETVVITLSLFDVRSSSALGREVVQSKDVSSLPDDIDRAVRSLTADTAAVETGGPSPLLIGGAVGVGVGGLAAGLGSVFALAARDTLANASSTGQEKTEAANARPLWAILTLGGATVAVAGAGLAVAGLVVE